jgi:two-component system response regulator RegA
VSDALVLIVDDDELFLSAVSRAFRHEGYAITTALDYESAMAACRRDPIDLAVVDLHLPERSGMEVLEGIKLLRPHARVVLVSGYASIAIAVDAMRQGALDCVPKSAGVGSIVAAFSPVRTGQPMEPRVPSLTEVEWEHIQRVLRDCNNNVSAAARKLGVPRRSLQRKLRRR